MSGPIPLRVVTFNLRGGRGPGRRADVRAAAEIVAAARPDLAGLQEVFRRLPPPGIFQDQPAHLRRVAGLEVAFRPSFGLAGWGYGNAILSRERPERLLRLRLPGRGEPRTLLEARFRLGGRAIRFLNTHLGLPPEERRAQAALLAERVLAAGEPVILVGDLNAGPDSPELALLREAGLREVAPPEVLTYPAAAPARRIDHILASPHFRTAECRALPTEVSDHLPLVADLWLD